MNRVVTGTSKILFLLLLSVAGLGISLQAQEHSYVHYDVRDGLAGSTVYCMAQDKDGFVWFGTETGLSRFDGTHFLNFTTQDGLPDNEILKVFVDSRNRVWLTPFKNTVAYYYKGEIHTAKNDPVLKKLKLRKEVACIAEDSAGNIMILDSDHLYIIDSKGNIRTIESFEYHGIKYLFQHCGLNNKLGFRISATDRGPAFVLDLYKNKLVQVKLLPETHSKTSLVLLFSPDLEIYEGPDSIIFFKPRDSSYIRLKIPSGFISVSRINDSICILNSNANTFLFNIRQKKITDSFLNGQSVNSSMEDSEGNLWFSTLGRGVYRLGSMATRNYSFKRQNYILPVFCIEKFDSVFYFGSDHFLLFGLDLRTGLMKSLTLYNYTTRGRVTCMLHLKSGAVVLGSDLGIFEMNGFERPAIIRVLYQSVKSLAFVKDSAILETFNLGACLRSLHNYADVTTLHSTRSTCGYYDNGNYYIGSLDGLYSVDKSGKEIMMGDRYRDLSNRITAIDKDMDGVLWITTEGDGLVGYCPGKPLIHITATDGLTSNICRSLFLSGKDIWVGTDKGLNKVSFSSDSLKVIPYTIADGLASEMINAIYVQGNEVYVGTSDGVTYFNDNNVSKRSGCLLRITGMTVSEKQFPTDSVDFHLSHENNNIKFSFVGISYKSAGNILYRYRLMGLDSAWKTTRETYLSYPSLPSGNYELQILATNKFGLTSQEMHIPFYVDKLLWEKAWFRILFIIAIALSVVVFFNYRVQLIRKKESEKSETVKKIAELEQMALRSQMNPHFIFNCLNSIQEYVLYKDVLGVNEFITKFSTLIRKTLQISNQPFISLEEEIAYISTYLDLEKRRFENKFIYEIIIGGEVDIYRCVIPPMILQPYLENAIRHGIGLRSDKSGKIAVRMSYGGDALVCVVEDNGIGRRQAARFKSANAINYQSFGMRLVEKRLAMLDGTGKKSVVISIDDLEDVSGSALGTRITLRFPLSIVLE